jgi:hypothetical protein
MSRLALIHELIEIHQLTAKTRRREVLFKRYYLFNELREAGLNLMQIAEIFGKNHATIINGLRVHKELLSYKDSDYVSETKIISEYLGDSKFLNDLNLYKRKKVYDLRQDVLNSTNFQHVKRIQRRIKLGYYEKKEEPTQLLAE